jgi:hypothetical protein
MEDILILARQHARFVWEIRPWSTKVAQDSTLRVFVLLVFLEQMEDVIYVHLDHILTETRQHAPVVR